MSATLIHLSFGVVGHVVYFVYAIMHVFC